MPNHFRPLPAKDQMDPARLEALKAKANSSREREREEKVFTYMYNDHKVYVSAAKTYQEAIDLACELFPELCGYPREQISLVVSAKFHEEKTPVEISASAWQGVTSILHRYEIIHVQVLDKPRSPMPGPMILEESSDSPPQYSAPAGQLHLSTDGLKAGQRSHSHSPSRSPSPSFGDRVKQFFKGDPC